MIVRIPEWSNATWTKVHTYLKSATGELKWIRTDLIRI